MGLRVLIVGIIRMNDSSKCLNFVDFGHVCDQSAVCRLAAMALAMQNHSRGGVSESYGTLHKAETARPCFLSIALLARDIELLSLLLCIIQSLGK